MTSRLMHTFRPIDTWPGALTTDRKRSPFVARSGQPMSYLRTLELLERELEHLDAYECVMQVALREGDIRLDGQPRANAKASHPGVIIAFDSKYGPLKYATDVFDRWQDNVRAIALALEALRKVDRYGVTKRGEQYTGWKAIGTGSERARMTREQAAAFVIEHAAVTWRGDPYTPAQVANDTTAVRRLYRHAARALHPDNGGAAGLFEQLQEAMEVLA